MRSGNVPAGPLMRCPEGGQQLMCRPKGSVGKAPREKREDRREKVGSWGAERGKRGESERVVEAEREKREKREERGGCVGRGGEERERREERVCRRLRRKELQAHPNRRHVAIQITVSVMVCVPQQTEFGRSKRKGYSRATLACRHTI
eukprot:2694851-Rhodomonas_salina.2